MLQAYSFNSKTQIIIIELKVLLYPPQQYNYVVTEWSLRRVLLQIL